MSEAAKPPDDSGERKEQYLARVSHVQMGMAPRNFEEGLRMAELLARSTLVPSEFRGNPGNVLIAIQMGMEIGLPPMQALQGIAVINGRPSLWGDALLALVQSSSHFEWIDEPPVHEGTATCTVKRRGWPNPVSRTFSVDDAKKAGLWNKTGPWQQYPDRMLRMRARAFALRDVFADVLRGISSAEEMLDVSNPAVTETKPDPELLMRNDLQASPEEWNELRAVWTRQNTSLPRRILQAKTYAGRAAALLEALKVQEPESPPPAITAIAPPEPKLVTKHARKRLAKAKAEGTSPSPGVVASIAEALGPDTGATASASPAASEPLPSSGPNSAGTFCEHGIDITAPCPDCKALAAQLDAEAAAQTTVKPETPQEYAARRKKVLAALNAKIAPPETTPF